MFELELNEKGKEHLKRYLLNFPMLCDDLNKCRMPLNMPIFRTRNNSTGASCGVGE